MKPKQEPENDLALNKALRQWTVDTPLPPRFEAQVWHRIERAESSATVSFGSALRRWLQNLLPRPKLAYSYAVVLLALGMLGGAWAAQTKNTRMEASLGTRYLQSIDPYQSSRPGQ
jgi:hypothetical protein